MNFSGQTTVITGGSYGMGAAAAKLFADIGAMVYILDISKPSIVNKNIRFIHCDVSILDNVIQAINIIHDEQQIINNLFANAGILLSAKLIDSPIDAIEKTIDINLKGMIYVLKCLLPIMIKNNGGNIVLMGSDQSLIGKPDNSVYGCTKAAIAQLTKSLAIENAQHNIRINCICPGTIDTPFVRNAVQAYAKRTNTNPKNVFDELCNAQPIKRLGTAEEIANLVLFLCSNLCSYMTGSIISVDGGYTAQ